MTHCRSLLLRPRSRVMSGAATISEVFAMTTISRLRQSTTRANQRRAYGPVIFSTGVLATNGIGAPGGQVIAHRRVDTRLLLTTVQLFVSPTLSAPEVPMWPADQFCKH